MRRATVEDVRAGTRTIEVTHVEITDAGREAISALQF
jgi:hypothetical protein